MAEFTQFRIHIGPPFLRASDPYFYNWSAHNLNASDSFLSDATLTSTLADGGTSLVLSGTALSYPNVGGMWVSGNGAGQAWEYVKYSSRSNTTFFGLQREPAANREHNGIHTAGATARFWWKITSNDGKLHLTEQIDEKFGVVSWTATFSGTKFPQAALRNGHLCVVQTRSTYNGAWTNLLVGFLDTPEVSDDASRVREWSVNIISSAVLAGRTEIDSIRSGELDIAKGASVTASSTLVGAWKEANTGDYSAAAPDFSAASVTDSDAATLWIAGRAVGTEPTHAINNDPMQSNITDAIVITGVHIAPANGQGSGYRWLELTAIGNQAFVGRELIIGSETASESFGLAQYLSAFNSGEKIILCENSTRFNAENPEHGAKQVVDLTAVGKGDLLSNRNASGGAFGLFHVGGGGYGWDSVVAWGTGTVARVISAHTGSITTETSPTFGPGGSVGAPAAGQTIRYNWANTTTPKNNYTISFLGMPGYALNSGKKQWLKLDVPGMGLQLKSDLTSSYTGAITIWDGTGETTGGLPASGTVQIGTEQIAYNSKTATTITLTSRTGGMAHVAGDAVYLVDGGVATDAVPVREIRFHRQGGTVYRKNFIVRGSRLLTEARTPDEAGYTADYHYSQSITNSTTADYTLTLSPSQRLSACVVEYDLMTFDPARPRENRIEFVVDESYYDAEAWLYSGQTSAQLSGQLLRNAGLPAGAISEGSGTPTVSDHTTGKAAGMALLQSMADYANLRVDCWRDSKIRIDPSPFWTQTSFLPQFISYRLTASKHKYVFSSPDALSQLVQPWRNPANTVSGTVSYPATPLYDGAIEELPESIYADATAALLATTKQFWLRRYPYQLVIECAQSRLDIRPGTIVQGLWLLDESMQQLDRDYIVVATDNSIDGGIVSTTLTLREIERVNA